MVMIPDIGLSLVTRFLFVCPKLKHHLSKNFDPKIEKNERVLVIW
jgi:hypothetical protein